MPHLEIGRYHPQSTVKRILRPLVIHDRVLGKLIVSSSTRVLEWCRRAGLRWTLLSSCQGVLGDALFWKGVRDELGDRDQFDALTKRAPIASE